LGNVGGEPGIAAAPDRLDPTVIILPGGMVELALRELGAVLVRVLHPED
jgi:hypothetical protein